MYIVILDGRWQICHDPDKKWCWSMILNPHRPVWTHEPSTDARLSKTFSIPTACICPYTSPETTLFVWGDPVWLIQHLGLEGQKSVAVAQRFTLTWRIKTIAKGICCPLLSCAGTAAVWSTNGNRKNTHSHKTNINKSKKKNKYTKCMAKVNTSYKKWFPQVTWKVCVACLSLMLYCKKNRSRKLWVSWFLLYSHNGCFYILRGNRAIKVLFLNNLLCPCTSWVFVYRAPYFMGG